MDVNISTAQKLMYSYAKAKKPFFLHGAPGIGKSDSVRQVCKKIAKENNTTLNEIGVDVTKFNLIDVRISQLDPSDLRGIPFPVGKETKWLIPSWLPKEGKGVIFFDEINLAPPSIQASCYQLILDRKLGDYVLPDDWTILAAGNRAIDMANVFPMSAPLKNRFSHATLMSPSEEEWREWAFEEKLNADIIGFLAFKPTLLNKFDKTSKDDAFPTPRSWAVAAHMLDTIKDKTTNEYIEDSLNMVSSCVGEGTALEFHGYIKLKKKVNINDILKNPKKVKELDNNIGLKYTLISGLSEKYKSDRKLMDAILAVVDYMDNEFSVFLLRLMKGTMPKEFVKDIMAAPNWKPLFKELGKFIM